MTPHIPLPSAWRREALRTNLWLVPTVEIVLAVALFAGTYALDRAAYNGTLAPPLVRDQRHARTLPGRS